MVKGYLPGVFDLFHIGHLNIIKAARANVDLLTVGLTSDVRALEQKGRRPIIPYNERKQILEAICGVDHVVPINSDDLYYSWEELRFSKIFVGSDWKESEKWAKLTPYFAERNVDIVFLPYTETTSSTLIRRTLANTMRGLGSVGATGDRST